MSFTDLAAQASTMVKGINWDALDAKGQGVPLDPNVPAKLGYWVDYLGPAFNSAADVMNTLYYDPHVVNTASTESAVQVMYRALQDMSPQVQTYERFSNWNLLLSPMPIPIEDFRLMVSFVWGIIMYGTKLHTTFAITALGRQAMRDHAQRIVMLCEALALLDGFGALNRLKWDSEEMVALRQQQGFTSLRPFTDHLQGLGAVPTVGYRRCGRFGVPKPDGRCRFVGPPMRALGLPPVLAGLAIVLGAAVLMYGVYEWSKTTTEINKQTLDITTKLCSDPNYANDAATKERCVSVLGDALAKSTMVNIPGVSELVKYGAIALGIAAVISFAPEIIRALKGAAAEARKPASA